MKPSTLLLFVTITGLSLTLGSCVAEKDFDNSKFEAVSPDSNSASGETSEETGEIYKVRFETSKGDFVIEVHSDWAPLGAAQFKEIVNDGVFDDARFFRVIEGFMVQFGIAGDPELAAKWEDKNIQDDPVIKSNTPGMVSFATSGPNSRTSQVFINFGNNAASLDPQGFSPFGKVIEGREVVMSLYSGYGEGAPRGKGPEQGRIQAEGNAYLIKEFPELDYIKKASIIKEESGAQSK